MEDSKSATAPLLLSHNSSQNETLNPKQSPPPPPLLAFPEQRADMDDEWSHKGGILQAVLVSMAWVFDAQQTFITVFTDADPSLSSSSDINNNNNNNNNNSSSSILSEWGLESASSLVRGLPASAFFLGCLVGGALLASLADSSLGRKRMLLLSCWVMSVSSLLTAFSPNLWAYSALRFISGFGRASIGTCALVLSTELVGKRWRAHVGSHAGESPGDLSKERFETIVEECLGFEGVGLDPDVSRSNWAVPILSHREVRVDAYVRVSFEMGRTYRAWEWAQKV